MKTHEREVPPDDIDEAKRTFEALRHSDFNTYMSEHLSEADTRSKIIDVILRDILGWPEGLIRREPHVSETNGYIDYLLSTSHPYFVVEAKRRDHIYSIPLHRTRMKYKVGGVLRKERKSVV